MIANRLPRGRHGVRIWELSIGDTIIRQTVARDTMTVVNIKVHNRKREPYEITWDNGKTYTYGRSATFEVL